MRVPLAKRRRDGRRTATILGLLAIAALSLVVVRAQANQLRLVSTAWPPFTNAPGQPRFALDLVEAALGRIGVTTSTTIVDAAQFTPALLTGQFDGSAAAWKDPERERVLLFSQPYLENRLILVGRQGADVSARSRANKLRVDDFGGGTFTVDNTGYLGTNLVMPILNVPEVGIVTMEAITKRPVVVATPDGDVIAIRPVMNMVLGVDHRANDGAGGAALLRDIKAWLESVGPDTAIY